MSKFERLLMPGSTEMPECQCGAEMHLARSTQTEEMTATEVRIYGCSACGHELRLMVWAQTTDDPPIPVGSL
jgi:hypothetical protein